MSYKSRVISNSYKWSTFASNVKPNLEKILLCPNFYYSFFIYIPLQPSSHHHRTVYCLRHIPIISTIEENNKQISDSDISTATITNVKYLIQVRYQWNLFQGSWDSYLLLQTTHRTRMGKHFILKPHLGSIPILTIDNWAKSKLQHD